MYKRHAFQTFRVPTIWRCALSGKLRQPAPATVVDITTSCPIRHWCSNRWWLVVAAVRMWSLLQGEHCASKMCHRAPRGVDCAFAFE